MPFYCHLIKEKNKYTQKTLIGRTVNISNQNGVNLLKYIYIYNDSYGISVKRDLEKVVPPPWR